MSEKKLSRRGYWAIYANRERSGTLDADVSLAGVRD